MWSTLVSLFLLLLLPVPASADTCDVAAAKVARETGAKLDETFLTKLPNSRILVHPQFGDLDMVCGPSDRPGRLEITIRVATAFPDDAYFKTVAKAGGAVSGASPSDVARAAAACQRHALESISPNQPFGSWEGIRAGKAEVDCTVDRSGGQTVMTVSRR